MLYRCKNSDGKWTKWNRHNSRDGSVFTAMQDLVPADPKELRATLIAGKLHVRAVVNTGTVNKQLELEIVKKLI